MATTFIKGMDVSTYLEIMELKWLEGKIEI